MTVQEIRAWGVHLFTMSGAVCGFMALANIAHNDPKDAIWWLILALIIDGVDGTLARKYEVTEHLPNVDGVTIDNIVDYLTYVVVPAFYVWWLPILPEGWTIPAAAAILMSSQYHFSDLRHKTHDNYFRGFPALWNLVIFGFYVFDPQPWTALIFIACFAVATFIPVKFVHPFRVEQLRRTNLAVATLGSIALIVAVWTSPEPMMAAKVVLVAAMGWFLLLGLNRHGKTAPTPDSLAEHRNQSASRRAPIRDGMAPTMPPNASARSWRLWRMPASICSFVIRLVI